MYWVAVNKKTDAVEMEDMLFASATLATNAVEYFGTKDYRLHAEIKVPPTVPMVLLESPKVSVRRLVQFKNHVVSVVGAGGKVFGLIDAKIRSVADLDQEPDLDVIVQDLIDTL